MNIKQLEALIYNGVMTMPKLIVTHYKYLKTPKYSWSLQNTQGGSFSNSGTHASLTKCLKHAMAMIQGQGDFRDIPAELVTVYGFTESDEAIESREILKLRDFV